MHLSSPARRTLSTAVKLVVVAVAIVVALLFVQRLTNPAAPSGGLDFSRVEIRTVPVQGPIFMLVGLGGNITVQIGEDGVLLVDSQYDQIADKNLAAISALSSRPVSYIINTHAHVDHISGNARLAASGGQDRTVIMAHRNVLLRHSAAEGGRRKAVWPTDVYGFGERTIRFNGEDIRLIHQPKAHTDGDTIISFETSNVVSAGDIYNETRYPYIDKWTGGSFRGIVEGLDTLVDLVVNDGRPGTMIVPGHGELQDEAAVVAYRDMIKTIRDRIRGMLDEGMSLEEIQAAGPTREFDSKYGSESGWWSTAEFVREVALELREEPVP